MGHVILDGMSHNTQPVRVDRSAVAVPAEADIRDFLASQRVFISSHMESLKSERRAIAEAVRDAGAQPVWFEEFGGRDADPENAYLAEVAGSSIYVGVLGGVYGRQDPVTRYSATHAEYRAAETGGLRISVWTANRADWGGLQQEFVNEVQTFHVTGSFDSPEGLADGVTQRLRQIAAEELSPWCKLGHLIFRASEIHASGDEIVVTAYIRDAQVGAEIEDMDPQNWRGTDLAFTDAYRSLRVDVREVSTTTTSIQSRRLRVTLARRPPTDSWAGGIAYQAAGRTYAPNDLTELALREHLFQEINPAQSAFVSLPNPLDGFPRDLSEEVIRPVLRLFITEALVGGGRARRVITVRLGVPIKHRRRLLLEWEGSSAYSQPTERRAIEGDIQL